MKKHQYKPHDRVMVFDGGYWVIPATVMTIKNGLYQVEYDCGGREWFVNDELRPLEYHKGDYVQTMIGVGKVVDVAQDRGFVTVSYGKHHKTQGYYEFEIRPMTKPSLWEKLLKKDVYLYNITGGVLRE